MIRRRVREPVTLTLSFTVEIVHGFGPPVVKLNLIQRIKEDLLAEAAAERLVNGTKRRYFEGLTRRNTMDLGSSVMATKRYLAPRHVTSAENVQLAVQKIREKERKALDDRANDVYAKNFVPKKYARHSIEYGRPPAGSLTEMRAKKAAKHIAREMLQLCEVIEEYGHRSRTNNKIVITFGDLFHIYQFISDKVVGMLLRARKHGMVEFDGEMLYQRRDEATVITLLISHEQIQQSMKEI